MEMGPVYIAGVSYSGKTQMRLMLSAHPNIVITRRTYMWRTYYKRFGDLSEPQNFENCLEEMMASKHIQMLNPNPERIRQEFAQGEPNYARLFAIIHRQFSESLGKKRWGNQQGLLENDAALIFAYEPEAFIIHMVRNPLDRIEESVSRSRHRRGKIGWETSFWQQSSQLALRNLEEYPQRYMVVHCERLFSDPETTLRDVCDFMGEDFHPETLMVNGLAEMGIEVPEKYIKRDQAADKKKRDIPIKLSVTEKSFIQSQLRSEMSVFGYSSTDQRLPFVSALKYTFLEYPMNLAGSVLWEAWGSKRFNNPELLVDYRS